MVGHAAHSCPFRLFKLYLCLILSFIHHASVIDYSTVVVKIVGCWLDLVLVVIHLALNPLVLYNRKIHNIFTHWVARQMIQRTIRKYTLICI